MRGGVLAVSSVSGKSDTELGKRREALREDVSEAVATCEMT